MIRHVGDNEVSEIESQTSPMTIGGSAFTHKRSSLQLSNPSKEKDGSEGHQYRIIETIPEVQE